MAARNCGVEVCAFVLLPFLQACLSVWQKDRNERDDEERGPPKDDLGS